MASGIPLAQPVTAHDPEYDEENIPVAQAFVPGAHPSYQFVQATPVAAQPVYNTTPAASYPQSGAGKVPPTPLTPYTPYNNDYDPNSKPVAAGTLNTEAPAKCLGLPRKVFFLILGLIVLIIVGVAVGAGVAASSGGSKKSNGSSSPPGVPVSPSDPVSNSPPAPGSPSTPVTDFPPAPGTPPEQIPTVTLSPNPPQTGSPPAIAPSTSPSPPTKTPAPSTRAPSPTSAPSTFTGTYGVITSDGQDLVTAINQARVKNGVKALKVDSTLVCTAQQLSENKGGSSNPTCDSTGYPLATRINQCSVTFSQSINQLTGCQYFIATFQVDSWASDSRLSTVLLDPTFAYVGGDGYHDGKFWTAVFA